MYSKIHETTLTGVMSKSGEYPAALRDAKSILVKEQANLIPTYMPGNYINYLEAKINDAERNGENIRAKVEQKNAHNLIEEFRGQIQNLIYGMNSWGSCGYPDLMIMTNDVSSPNSAIAKPKNNEFSFEIRPKNFRLGLTGRILEDEGGERYEEELQIGLDIYDAFNFAREITPEVIVALSKDGTETVVYEKEKYVVGKKENIIREGEKHYIMHEKKRANFRREQMILPTNGKKLVKSDFYKSVEKYEEGCILIGHKYDEINQFLAAAKLKTNHFIWKTCMDGHSDLNSALLDAERFYGPYKGKPRYENISRLHFMPNKANMFFENCWISFDWQTGIKAVGELGEVLADLWLDDEQTGFEIRRRIITPPDARQTSWDIVLDRTRGINPEKPHNLHTHDEFEKYLVLK